MKLNNLHDALIHELRNLYSAEVQLTKALPIMVKAAANEELVGAFEHHLEETKSHVERLENIFEELDFSPGGGKPKALEGLIEDAKKTMEEDATEEVLDALAIGIAQKIEHYEIAAYGTVRTFAEHLRLDDIADMLQKTLDEEAMADETLTRIAEDSVNEEAAQISAQK